MSEAWKTVDSTTDAKFPGSQRPVVRINVATSCQLVGPGLHAGSVHHGEIINLCVHGMAVHLKGVGELLRAGQHFRAEILLDSRPAVAVQAEVVHLGADRIGCRFPPLANAAANDSQERTLWLFLLDEQRRLRRERQTARAG